MTIRALFASAAFAALATAAAAQDVTLRFLASHGGLNAHELAAELGYF